ncbi:hypothetical protein G7Y79_00023g054630 [Physcia stellaris]|nr:hypothetical protein G7Y79_00023g054630 [Physcia stellaris]
MYLILQGGAASLRQLCNNIITLINKIKSLTYSRFLNTASCDPLFLMTLPFDQNRIPPNLTDNVLLRVRRRWEWFSEAKARNAALGTLLYLPGEIRTLIWQNLLLCKDTQSLDGIWEYGRTLGPPFQLSSFYFGFDRRGLFLESAENVRLVSSQVKAEYDHVFLHMRTFRFNYADNLFSFMDRIEDIHLEQLSSIELAICTQFSMQTWLDSIAYLPAGLKHVHFRLLETRPDWYQSRRGLKSLEHLGTIVDQAAQKAPKASISISSVSCKPLQEICQAAVDGILARIREAEHNV